MDKPPRRYALQKMLTKPDRSMAPSQIFTVCLGSMKWMGPVTMRIVKFLDIFQKQVKEITYMTDMCKEYVQLFNE